MTRTCTFCNREYSDDHEWISVSNITAMVGQKTCRCEGQMSFCSVSCLNTFIYSMGDSDAV